MDDSTRLIVLGAGVLIAVIVVVVGVISARRDNLVEERLDRMSQGASLQLEVQDEAEDKAAVQERRELLKGLDNALAQRKFGQKWRRQLARADIKLTVAEFAALHFVGSIGGFLLGFIILFRGEIVSSIVAGFIGFFVPRIYVARTVSKRLISFETQLPDTLSLWVNALRSGYSVMQAMEAIAKDAGEPTSAEFKRVVQEVQLGIDMTDALEHLLERVESEDLDLVITAVNIQHEVGGNLAEILDVISGTIRERIKLKGEIRVLTAQGRITGYLISFLPIGLALFLNLINPGFMNPMFQNRLCGWPMLGAGLALIGIGTAVIQKIVDIEI